MKTVLTIAGSDCSGGAGIQADLKTIAAHGLYGMSAITSLTAQNTTGVYGISDVTPEFLAQQLDCIFTDIYPDAVKVGMVSDKSLINVIADKLVEYKARNIVVDTVMVSTSGSRLLKEDAMDALVTRLIPLADVITPNIPEAEVLSGKSIESAEDMIDAARIIYRNLRRYIIENKDIHSAKCTIAMGNALCDNPDLGDEENRQVYCRDCEADRLAPRILIKGGHERNTANDFLYSSLDYTFFKGERIDNPNTHGTGCTLSSAIACNLALGKSLDTAVSDSKKYISGALRDGLDLGKGSGPLNHMYMIQGSKGTNTIVLAQNRV